MKFVRYFLYFVIVCHVFMYGTPSMLNKYYNNLPNLHNSNKSISVIVPIKNEEDRLAPLMDALSNQTYQNFEVIFVDDGSTDRSIEIMNAFKERLEDKVKVIKTVRNKNKLTFCQHALETGARAATKDIILFTNAGCSFDRNLLEKLASCYYNDKVAAVVLRYRPSKSSLITSGSLQILGDQLMSDLCQVFLAFKSFIGARGTGLSFLREAYLGINGQFAIEGQTNEDVALAGAMFKKGYKVIGADLFVEKTPKESLLELSRQHIRWLKAQKGQTYSGYSLVSFMLFAYHLATPVFWWYLGPNAFLKLLADYLFVNSLNKNAGLPLGLWSELKTTVVYPYYYCYVYLASLIPTKMKWK